MATTTARHSEREQPRPKRERSRIPHFKTIEAESVFWDTHDLTEFEDELEVVTDVRFVRAEGRPAKKAITVRLEADTLEALTQQARAKGVGPSTLARMWIRERLDKAGATSSPQPRPPAAGRSRYVAVALLGQQPEGRDVAGPQQAEVAAVERRQLGLVHPLHDRQDGGVDEADVGVRVSVAQVADATVIRRHQVLDHICAIPDVVEQRDEHAGVKPRMDEIIHLDQDW